MIAKNEMRMVNFSSCISSIICLIRFGLKHKMKKKITQYQPQNFNRNNDVSITDDFILASYAK